MCRTDHLPRFRVFDLAPCGGIFAPRLDGILDRPGNQGRSGGHGVLELANGVVLGGSEDETDPGFDVGF